MDVMPIMKLVHMAWSGCIIGHPSEAGYYLKLKNTGYIIFCSRISSRQHFYVGSRIVNLPGNKSISQGSGKYREILGNRKAMGTQLWVANIMAWCLNQI